MSKRQRFPYPPSRRTLSLEFEIWFQALEFSVSRTVAEYIFFCCRTSRRNAEELLLYILGVRYNCRKHALLFSSCSFQEHSQSTISRRAHYVLSVWASGEKVLAQARALEPNCVQHIVRTYSYRFWVPSSRTTADKIDVATAVQEAENSSAWNHIFKFQ